MDTLNAGRFVIYSNNRTHSTAAILRQLRDITGDVERLDSGVSELEAIEIDMKNTPLITRDMRSQANFLTAMNNRTAESIQSSMRELEDVVRNELEGRAGMKELVDEFIRVLASTFHVLHEYRRVQQAYVDEINRRVTISPFVSRNPQPDPYNGVEDETVSYDGDIFTSTQSHTQDEQMAVVGRGHPFQWIIRTVKRIFVCGL